MEILNLTSLVASDKKIVIGDKEFLIPGNISTGRMLKLLHVTKELQNDLTNPDAMMGAFQVVHEVFQIRNPELTYNEFEDIITLDMLPQIVTFIYNVNTPDSKSEKKTTNKSGIETE